MNDTELLAPIRPLAGVEIIMSCMHSLMRGTSQATQVLHTSCILPFDAYLDASQKLLTEFPILGACIREYEGKAWFFSGANCRDIPLVSEMVSDSHEEERCIRTAVDDPLAQESSLWQIRVLTVNGESTTKIVMTFHHAILDGHGLSVVGTRFLHYLDNFQQGGTEEVAIRKFPPSINDFLSEKSSILPHEPVAPLPYEVAVPIKNRRTAWKSMLIDRTLRECIETRAKEDNLQYNSVLSAALIKAISDNRLYEEPMEFKSAVSLRIYEDMESIETSSLGCYMGISSMRQVARNKSVTEIAKAYQIGLVKDSLKRCFTKTHYSSQDIYRTMATSLESEEFTGGVGVTNIGDISIPRDYCHFELLDYFTTVNRIGGTYMVVVHLYKFNDIDTIQFVYPEPLTSEEKIDKLIQSFRYHVTYADRSAGFEEKIESSSTYSF